MKTISISIKLDERPCKECKEAAQALILVRGHSDGIVYHISKSLIIASIAVRNSASRRTFTGNVSHRLHIGFEDSSKSEGVVTRHCHFAESLGIAVNNCYICGNSKREYDYLSQYKRRFC